MAGNASCVARLEKALNYLQLAQGSRELTYDSIPWIVAAKMLVEEAIRSNTPTPTKPIQSQPTLGELHGIGASNVAE